MNLQSRVIEVVFVDSSFLLFFLFSSKISSPRSAITATDADTHRTVHRLLTRLSAVGSGNAIPSTGSRYFRGDRGEKSRWGTLEIKLVDRSGENGCQRVAAVTGLGLVLPG